MVPPGALCSRTPTSRCRSATAGRQARARDRLREPVTLRPHSRHPAPVALALRRAGTCGLESHRRPQRALRALGRRGPDRRARSAQACDGLHQGRRLTPQRAQRPRAHDPAGDVEARRRPATARHVDRRPDPRDRRAKLICLTGLRLGSIKHHRSRSRRPRRHERIADHRTRAQRSSACIERCRSARASASPWCAARTAGGPYREATLHRPSIRAYSARGPRNSPSRRRRAAPSGPLLRSALKEGASEARDVPICQRRLKSVPTGVWVSVGVCVASRRRAERNAGAARG